MPLYEYECRDCGTRFEVRRPMRSSDEPAECPHCASVESERRVSLFMTIGKVQEGTQNGGGGCGCGGQCSCGGHSYN